MSPLSAPWDSLQVPQPIPMSARSVSPLALRDPEQDWIPYMKRGSKSSVHWRGKEPDFNRAFGPPRRGSKGTDIERYGF